MSESERDPATSIREEMDAYLNGIDRLLAASGGLLDTWDAGDVPSFDAMKGAVERLRRAVVNFQRFGQKPKRPAAPVQGWRDFQCDCGVKWRETCRDACTPSGVDCPRCGVFSRPVAHEVDPSIPVDEFGNLLHEVTEFYE